MKSEWDESACRDEDTEVTEGGERGDCYSSVTEKDITCVCGGGGNYHEVGLVTLAAQCFSVLVQKTCQMWWFISCCRVSSCWKCNSNVSSPVSHSETPTATNDLSKWTRISFHSTRSSQRFLLQLLWCLCVSHRAGEDLTGTAQVMSENRNPPQ